MAACLAVEAAFFMIGDKAEANSPMWWLSAAGALGAFLLFWAFVDWRTEER